MEILEIKDDVLHISDKQKYWQIELDMIDIISTEGFNIEVKLENGKQAILHLDKPGNKEEFDILAKLLTNYPQFFRCDGNMIVNLSNLRELTLVEEKNNWGYYDLNMQFKKMRGGLCGSNLQSLREAEQNIKIAKQNYELTQCSKNI